MLSLRQQQCLRGIGIDIWSERRLKASTNSDRESVSEILTNDEIEELHRFAQRPGAASKPSQNGVVEQESKSPEISSTPEIDASRSVQLDSWPAIIDAIEGCTACELAQNCTRKVPGIGDKQAELLIVGEGPGHDEDIRGEPFVGRSGQLLDRMLAAIGFTRDQVYITNIVKCRPPNNRDPNPPEAQQCRGFLEAQIKQLDPRVILSVGRVSAQSLLDSNLPVGKLIRQMHKLPGTDIPLKVTYHPAYLLRNPSAKAVAWQDLKQLYQMLQ